MSGLPYYKAYPRDFLEGTIGLPFEVKCAYRVLLDMIYMRGGKLPDDPRYISGQLGCSLRKWASIKNALVQAGKIRVSSGLIQNYRADKEIETLAKLQDKQAENARQPRKNNDLQKPWQGHTEPEPEPEEVKDKSSTSSQSSSSENLDGLYDDVLSAAGIKSGVMSQYWMPPAAIVHVNRWVTDLGLTRDQVIETVRQKRKGFDAPPNGPKAFDFAMMNYAAALKAPAMQPSASRKQVDGYRATDPELAMSNAAMRKKMENYRLELERQSLAEWQTAGAGTA